MPCLRAKTLPPLTPLSVVTPSGLTIISQNTMEYIIPPPPILPCLLIESCILLLSKLSQHRGPSANHGDLTKTSFPNFVNIPKSRARVHACEKRVHFHSATVPTTLPGCLTTLKLIRNVVWARANHQSSISVVRSHSQSEAEAFMSFLTFTQSTGYITLCSMIPAAAPANMCVVIVLDGGKPSYGLSSSIVNSNKDRNQL